jgi:hypothetical protein
MIVVIGGKTVIQTGEIVVVCTADADSWYYRQHKAQTVGEHAFVFGNPCHTNAHLHAAEDLAVAMAAEARRQAQAAQGPPVLEMQQREAVCSMLQQAAEDEGD